MQACSPSAPLLGLADPATAASRSLPLTCASAVVAATSSPSPAHGTQEEEEEEEGTMCLERLATGSCLGLVPHPDGSARAFLYTLDGKVWLASVPKRGSGAALRVDGSPFLDLTDRVHHDAPLGLGLMGVAFHPRFTSSGRVFVSYYATPERCSAAAAGNDDEGSSYQLELVVAELSAARGGDDQAAKVNTVRSLHRLATSTISTSCPAYVAMIMAFL